MSLDFALEPAPAFLREAGSGTGVVCLHATGSSSAQWKPLMERLADRFHLLAVDLYGSGKTPQWPGGRALRLADEVALLRTAMSMASEPFHLIGHSYGAAVALKTALTHGRKLRSLVIFEPVFFSVLLKENPCHPGALEIMAARRGVREAADAGDTETSAQRFIDYWGGSGSWAKIPGPRRPAALQALAGLEAQWDALLGEPTKLPALASLEVPTLLMVGSSSPASSRAVAELLAATLPNVQVLELAGVGHMGPITHAEQVNAAIESFLASVA